jgi:hypothetical protein
MSMAHIAHWQKARNVTLDLSPLPFAGVNGSSQTCPDILWSTFILLVLTRDLVLRFWDLKKVISCLFIRDPSLCGYYRKYQQLTSSSCTLPPSSSAVPEPSAHPYLSQSHMLKSARCAREPRIVVYFVNGGTGPDLSVLIDQQQNTTSL